MARSGRNSALTSSLGRLSKTQLKAKKGYHKRLDKPAATAASKEDTSASETKEKEIGGSKNGGKRLIPVHKAPRFYPAEDISKSKISRKSSSKSSSASLRKTITPGTILILLAGKFRGKRVVYLKQLPSGLLLVTGPYKLNKVPVRRVNQAYVIATSTKVDLAGLKIDDKFDDAHFKKAAASRSKGTEAEFFKDGEKAEPTEADKEQKAARSSDQKSLDKAILEAISKTPNLEKYLSSSFSLSKGQFPHLMKF